MRLHFEKILKSDYLANQIIRQDRLIKEKYLPETQLLTAAQFAVHGKVENRHATPALVLIADIEEASLAEAAHANKVKCIISPVPHEFF